jgi:hypothetical protein
MGKSYVYFFYMNGCGFCEEFEKNVWNKLNFKKYPKIKFFKIESNDIQKKEKEYMDELGKSFKSMLKLESIQGFPEIKIVLPNKSINVFNDVRDLQNFEKWLSKQTSLSSSMKGGKRNQTKKNSMVFFNSPYILRQRQRNVKRSMKRMKYEN